MSPSRKSSSTPASTARARACASIAGEASISDDASAGVLSNRDRNAPVTNRKLDQWPVSLTGERDVERDVIRPLNRPLRVSIRPTLVGTWFTPKPGSGVWE